MLKHLQNICFQHLNAIFETFIQKLLLQEKTLGLVTWSFVKIRSAILLLQDFYLLFDPQNTTSMDHNKIAYKHTRPLLKAIFKFT